VGWGRRSDGHLLAPPTDSWSDHVPVNNYRRPNQLSGGNGMSGQELHIQEVFDSQGNVDPDRLEAWLLSHHIDPNDPRNAGLMASVTAAAATKGNGPSSNAELTSQISLGQGGAPAGCFRLDQMDDQFAFCTEGELNNNLRFQLLQLRAARAPDFRSYRMIPAFEKEIPRGILEATAKRLERRQKEAVDGSTADQLRGKHQIYLDQLRSQANHKFALAKHRKYRADLIVETSIPDLGTLFHLLGGIAPEQRPLRPVRQERKKIVLQDLSGQQVRLLLCVVRAYDVPVRNDADPVLGGLGPAIGGSLSGGSQLGSITGGPREARVNSFLRATLQNNSVRTAAAPGPNPSWNQELELKFKPHTDAYMGDQAGVLGSSRDSLHLHLYDEILVDLLDREERAAANQVHQRIEHKWLGSLAIPVAAIMQNTRIEGTFRLHSPTVLLGYERANSGGSSSAYLGWQPPTPPVEGAASGGVSGTAAASGASNLSMAKDATYVNIYLTLEPALNVPEPVREKLECEEEEAVVAAAAAWRRGQAAGRPVNPLVVDVTGKSVLMTRYLKPLAPPPEVLREDTEAAEAVAWFVSLIPYLPSNVLFPGRGQILRFKTFISFKQFYLHPH
jgi:coiled-coil and C2 domain-containing protein 2A